MIYLNTAATSCCRPPEVAQAVFSAMEGTASAGRGEDPASMGAARILFEARQAAAKLFHCAPEHVCFSSGATDSLNTALFGLLNPGDHVVTTMAEHNAVLRPLYALRERGAEVSFLPADARGCVDPADLPALMRRNTKLVVCSHASNVTGNVLPVSELARTAHAHGALFLLDAAQSAGHIPVDMEALDADIVAFTGHKGLMGLTGTGGLAFRTELPIRPLRLGGTGFASDEPGMPEGLPERLEAGTQNIQGIAGLSAGIRWVQAHAEEIQNREACLGRILRDGLSRIPGMTLYGDGRGGTPVLSVNLSGWDPGELADVLLQRYGIASRPGLHCAPLCHQALGTGKTGTLRLSWGVFNTEDEIDTVIRVFWEISRL